MIEFENKKIIPMGLVQQEKPFDDKDFIFEMKLDGIRAIAFCDKSKTEIFNRKLNKVDIYFPELLTLHKQCKKKCILDGEIVCLDKNGKPSFELLQHRNLVKNKQKIKKMIDFLPVSFVAFDILFFNNQDITHKPLENRKIILESNIVENEKLSFSRFIESKGKELFKQTKKKGLEGIVAKRKTSRYLIGKNSSDWIKIKHVNDTEFLVCGYIPDPSKKMKIKYLFLASKNKGKLEDEGKIYFGTGKADEQFILNFAKKHKLKNPLFENKDENIVWFSPKLVCTIEFLEKTSSGGLRHPVFKGIRQDKEFKP